MDPTDTVEKVENLKIDCALLSNARHCFMTIVNRERIAIKQMMIAGRCVFMRTIYIVYMKDYSAYHLQIIGMVRLCNEQCIRSCRDLAE